MTAKRSQIGRSPIEFNMFWKTPPLAGYRLADNRFPLCSLINIYASTEQMKNLLYEIAGLDDVFDKETQKFLEKEKQELGIKDDKD